MVDKDSPLVSVVIPTYNRPNKVKKAINSIFNQTFKKIELIIIDSSPNDNVKKEIEKNRQ